MESYVEVDNRVLSGGCNNNATWFLATKKQRPLKSPTYTLFHYGIIKGRAEH